MAGLPAAGTTLGSLATVGGPITLGLAALAGGSYLIAKNDTPIKPTLTLGSGFLGNMRKMEGNSGVPWYSINYQPATTRIISMSN